MQHCTVCGSEIPDDASFCGKCGNTLSQVSTMDEETTRNVTSSKNGRQLEDVTTQGLVHAGKKEREVGGKPEPQARRGFARKWIMLAVVCILLLAGSAGAFLFLQHSKSPVSSGTISPTSHTTTTGVTPVSTACPTSSTSFSCVTTTGLTPVAGTKSIFTLSFSGAVKGSMMVTSMTRCGPTTAGTEYDLYFIGTVSGIQYTYVSRIPAYKGPNTYGTGQVSVVFAQQSLSATTVWGNSGNAPAKMTINGDLKSGSMEVDLAGATNSVHVSGNWSCG